MLRGIHLQYSGLKYNQFTAVGSDGSERLRNAFKNQGALAIRMQLGQSQRAALLQSICRDNYRDNPVTKAAEGGNQPDVFAVSASATEVQHQTNLLERLAHYTLGKSKILNEKTQPQKNRNTENLRGEQYLWEMIHSPIWTIGLNLAGQLSSQGFFYVAYPQGMSESDYRLVSEELANGLFTRKNDQIKTNSGHVLTTCRIQDVKIGIDPKHILTKQPNGFVMTVGADQSAPLGWMMHEGKTTRLVPTEATEDLFQIIRTAQGGSHKLTPAESRQLFDRRVASNEVRFTQNRSLNLLDAVVQTLEKEYGFDPSRLLGDSIKIAYTRVKTMTEQTEVVEDFLTGTLISEMVQPLKVTIPFSTRPELPHEFRNSFDITSNSAKAFAYSYEMKKPDGSPVLQTGSENPISPPDGDLMDVRISGELAKPELNNPSHVAALLATGVLVAEQMILEQLLSAACHPDAHPHAIALREILNNDGAHNNLVKLAKKLPHDSTGMPALGLQVPACEPIISLLRKSLGFNHLITIASELADKNTVTTVSENEKNAALLKLYNIGNVLQTLERTSVVDQRSRGINAGIVPVIEKLAPALYATLAPPTHPAILRKNEAKTENPKQEPLSQVAPTSYETSGCPYLRRMASAPESPASISNNPSQKRSWCQFFRRSTVIASTVVVGATAVATVVFMKTQQ